MEVVSIERPDFDGWALSQSFYRRILILRNEKSGRKAMLLARYK